jgi:hypothetical protein
MMKYKIIMMSMLLLIGVSSCEKYVDETKNWGAISEEGVWEDATKIELLVNAWYQRLRGTNPNRPDGNYGAENSSSVTCYHVGCAEAPLSRWGWVHEFNYDPHWKDLRVINQFLGNIDDAQAPNLTAMQKAQFKGQAHFFRAYIYFELVKVFGGVPIITEVLDITGDPTLLDLPRNTSLECFEFIEGQLDSAAMFLPLRGTNDYGEGRPDKLSALAHKVKTLVLKAEPRFCNTKVTEYWQDAYAAATAAKAIADANGFGLHPSNVEMWLDAGSRDIEWLFYGKREAPETRAGGARPGSAGNSSGSRGTWQLLQRYPMANGMNIDEEGSGYDPEMWWANRDPRFYENFNVQGQEWSFPDYPNNYTWMFEGSGVDGNNMATQERKTTNTNETLEDWRELRGFDWVHISLYGAVIVAG